MMMIVEQSVAETKVLRRKLARMPLSSLQIPHDLETEGKQATDLWHGPLPCLPPWHRSLVQLLLITDMKKKSLII
jgi:hypothetical protein